MVTNEPNQSSIADGLGGKSKQTEAMTLRCDRMTRRRIEEAWKVEKGERQKLTLGRFLSERVVHGLSLNVNPIGSQSAAGSPVDIEEVSQVVSIASFHATSEAIGREMVPIDERLAAIETMLGAVADVLRELAVNMANLKKL